MIVRENLALFECIRDRCKRTGTIRVLPIAKQVKSSVNVLLSYSFTVFLLRAIIHEFARVSRAIIYRAV